MASDQYEVNFGQNDGDLFRVLQSLCENACIKMDNLLTFYSSSQGSFFFREVRTGQVYETEHLRTIADASIQGCIYFMIWPPTEADENNIGTLLKNKKPVAVLDETASLKLSPQIANSRYLRIYNIAASVQPGVIVARHLLSLNHQRIAFFSADHHYAWSKLRLKGLLSHYEKTGLADGVVPFVVETPTIYEDSQRALAANISSYNFNVYGLGTAMLGFVLGRKPYVNAGGVQGYVVDRRSTGPARKR